MEKVRVGITGSSGFIGSHLVTRLKQDKNIQVIPFEKNYFKDRGKLEGFVAKCDVLVHLAAMNRGDENELYNINVELVKTIVSAMEITGAMPHVIFASSTQYLLNNAYGISKKEAAKILEEWALKNSSPLSILIIPNVFGEQCKPFYNSVVATFCYQLTHGEIPKIHVNSEVELIYINELTEIIHRIILNPPEMTKELRISGTKKNIVSELLSILEKFKDLYFIKKTVPVLENLFLSNLYKVFISYVNYDDYRKTPEIHDDERGRLFEIIKFEEGGQIFFSTTRPCAIRGNHYHTRKIERFCIIKGEAVVRLRRIGTEKVIEYFISKNEPTFIEIPVFHAHNIENIGKEDLYTLIWSNELFNPDDADTFFEKV
ncbi:MAG: hypothetical protein A2W05_07800 [Candidatus Schekmanbacteria bacterium RBG_16_38_10]|uniref:Uncharacterized protein n=1 Tax=Candidatus Schekmanbacteria bacterium RBG_16_38_10 TaxID=1817879 RepID=A0A1F7RYS4_9BACT|nr:MAG: hypothetical protein A2W05_07800 [Candidatus Schekmanbacteria bacterium RBG_16_38_10]